MTRQLPGHGEIFLDHVAHFVPQLDEATSKFEGLGFRLTPFTPQRNRTPQGMVSAGMANRCIMLREGYVELLTATGDTPLAEQFWRATSRYVGLHLVAFATADPEGAHKALQAYGFHPNEPVALTRQVAGPAGEQLEASFTVLRVPPDAMPEGRIQILQHHTEDAVWQEGWLGHANAITSLKAVMLAVADPEESANRFGRFVGRSPERRAERWVLPLKRGTCVFVAHEALPRLAPWSGAAPAAPCILATALGSDDTGLTREHFLAGGLGLPTTIAADQAVYALPPELGGFATVVPAGAEVAWSA